jgi:perosamine synthetase
MAISRGIIYHKLIDDFKFLIFSFFTNLNNEKYIKKFEKKFSFFNQSKYCIAMPFARTAFYFIIKSLKLQKGDEVIISPLQIKAMLEIILHFQLRPVIVDINKNDLNFNLKDLKNKINKKTKLVLLTYLYGIVPDLMEIKKTIGKKIFLVEDFSQCLGGKFKNIKVGNFGDFAFYSMSATKTLDAYGGAAIVTNYKDKYKLLKSNIVHLKSPSRIFLIKKIFVSLLRSFFTNRLIFTYFVIYILKFMQTLGLNFFRKFIGYRSFKLNYKKLPNLWFQKITSLQAEAGLKFIKRVKLDDDKRIKNASKIINFFNRKSFPCKNKNSHNVYWQLCLIHGKSELIQKKLLSKGIDIASPSIALLSKSITSRNLVANNLYKNIIFIPCYPSLRENELNLICHNLTKYV